MDYITLSNRIKDLFDDTWLTESQKEIYDTVMTKYQAHQIVNIFGQTGTGKTFLGWNIAKSMDGIYTSKIHCVTLKKIVVLDNWSYRKQDVRGILPVMRLNKIGKVIVVTEKKVVDDIVSIELLFTNSDKAKFKHNLWDNFNLGFNNEKNNDNMHSLIKRNLR